VVHTSVHLITSNLTLKKHKHWFFRAVIVVITLPVSCAEQADAMPMGGLKKTGYVGFGQGWGRRAERKK
jgi:hypothetical protein